LVPSLDVESDPYTRYGLVPFDWRIAMQPGSLEPVRPIRALLRGLEALAVLSNSRGLTVTETARRARLPRTTAYRILETLRAGGYVARDEDDRYILAAEASAAANGARNDKTDHANAA
jgi:hypothetical protein